MQVNLAGRGGKNAEDRRKRRQNKKRGFGLYLNSVF
jgi:hypothetical protein